MPLFEIRGVNPETGRQRKPFRVRARDEKAARTIARKEQATEPETIRPIRVLHYDVQLAGGSHPNRDGSSRQEIIKACSIGEFLQLEHEQGNRHDKHATRVLRADGAQLGYLPQDVAEEIYEEFFRGSGCRTAGRILRAVPYGPDDGRVHVELRILVAVADLPDAEVQAYLREHNLQDDAGFIDVLQPLESAPPESPRARPRPPKQETPVEPKSTGCLLSLLGIVALTTVVWNIAH